VEFGFSVRGHGALMRFRSFTLYSRIANSYLMLPSAFCAVATALAARPASRSIALPISIRASIYTYYSQGFSAQRLSERSV